MKKIIPVLISLLLMSTLSIHAGRQTVYLGGETVALQGMYEGVVVSGIYDFKIDEQWGSSFSPQALQIGDCIIEIEGKKIKTIDDLYSFMSLNPKRNAEYHVKVIRNHVPINTVLKVYYVEDEKVFKTGYYVKDKIKGIGTITFYNPVNQSYGALGHEIMDNDLGTIAEIEVGELFLASVNAITPSKPQIPGEKNCLNTQLKIGSIIKNNNYGLYGHYYYLPNDKKQISVASQKEVHLGQALIYTVLEDQTIIPVEIDITKVTLQTSKSIKGIQFTIHDEKVLNKTGGIIQGMSGSPIVQNGKLVGAVTHMITTEPENGYGIHIQWMIEESLSLPN